MVGEWGPVLLGSSETWNGPCPTVGPPKEQGSWAVHEPAPICHRLKSVLGAVNSDISGLPYTVSNQRKSLDIEKKRMSSGHWASEL